MVQPAECVGGAREAFTMLARPHSRMPQPWTAPFVSAQCSLLALLWPTSSSYPQCALLVYLETLLWLVHRSRCMVVVWLFVNGEAAVDTLVCS